MPKYLISFPSAAMRVPEGEWAAVGRDAHAVMDERQKPLVFKSLRAASTQRCRPCGSLQTDRWRWAGGHPWEPPALNGGFTVFALPSRDEAIVWAARVANACRCDEVVQYGPCRRL